MNKELKELSSVQSHLSILQGIIDRMSTGSSNCKTWAITIVAAILVILFDQAAICKLYIAIIPVLLFYLLDCFYLGMERHFRHEYNKFVSELENDNFDFRNVFIVKGPGKGIAKLLLVIKGCWSFSTTPFYLITATMIVVIQFLL